MSRVSSLAIAIAWWLCLILLGPLLWLQGRWAKWRTPRLAPLAAPLAGQAGTGNNSLNLLVLGESPAAGVGVSNTQDSLPAQFAEQIARQRSVQVAWQSIAENGADIKRVLQVQLSNPIHPQPDLVLVVLGVNDTTGLTARAQWCRRLRTLINAIRRQCHGPILFTSVPRLDSFTALPQPLRTVLGWRGRLLDLDLQDVTTGFPGVGRATSLPVLTAQQLAEDGYHPSAIACLDWATQLVKCIPTMPDRL